MHAIIFFLALYGFFLFLPYWAWIKPVLLIPVSPANHSLCLQEDVPDCVIEQLIQGIKDSEPLGFHVSHYLKYHEFYASINDLKHAVVLFNPEYKCYLVIENNFQPDAIRPYNTTFQIFTSNTIFCGYYLENTVFLFPNSQCISIIEEDISKRFKSFISFVNKKLKDKPEQTRLQFEPLEYCQHLSKINTESLENLVEAGLLKSKNKQLRFTIKGAFKFGFRVKNNQGKATKKERNLNNKLTPQPSYLIGAQTNAYHRSMQVHNSASENTKAKLIILILSAFIFFLVFGLLFDFQFALLLLPILFLHELGHLLAMKAFGYRNLQMVFMPFGALAIGKNEGISAVKRVVVSLAGPVPGIILGFYIGLSPSINHFSWASEVAFMLIVINYFNLLPFLPLDGGQVINHTLFSRYPKSQLAFFTLSVISFVSFAVYTKDPVIGTISLFLILSLFYQFKNFKIYSKLNKIDNTKEESEKLIDKMFSQLADEPMRYRQKFYTIFSNLNIISMPKAKLYEILIGLLLYISALYAPIYVINQYTDGSMWITLGFKKGNSNESNAFDERQYEPEYWRNKLAENLSNSKRFDVYIKAIRFIDSEKYDKAYEKLLNEALIYAKQNNLNTHKDYPELLKRNIMFLLWKSEDIKQINQALVDELKQIQNGESVQYARLILDLTYLQIDEDKLNEIEKAISIFKKSGDEYLMSKATQVKAIIHIQKQEYQIAGLTLLGLLDSKELYDFSSESLLIELYQTTNQLTKAKHTCLDFIEEERKFGKSGLLESCAWTELLNKDFIQAENYFNDAAKSNKKDLLNTIDNYLNDQELIDKMLAYQKFNEDKNLFILEWSKGNANKAAEILKRMDAFKETIKVDIDEQMEYTRKSKNLSPKYTLMIKAYDEIRNSIKNHRD